MGSAEQFVSDRKHPNVPGTSARAKIMLPFRVLLVTTLWVLLFPLLVTIAMLRALFMRVRRGRPSQILRTGRYNAVHMPAPDLHYNCMHTYTAPLDEARLRKALVELCAEDGISEEKIDLKFFAEEPNDWPASGSHRVDHFIESTKSLGKEGYSMYDYGDDRQKRGDPEVVMRIHVWNGSAGKPTVAYYYGPANRWDGSSQFNFTKELMNRYVGNKPCKVFQEPELAEKSARLFDRASFLLFILQLPFALAKNLLMILWNAVRAASWAGGNGFGFKCVCMNFTLEGSELLYAGAKKMGVSPFAAFTHAAVKACTEVLGERPLSITQQASLQTRHYPLPEQSNRDLVGDWLVGPVQQIPSSYGLDDAQKGYEDFQFELDTVGPAVQRSIMAKAYGLMNSGAAVFQTMPMYNTWSHCFSRNLFMNNYGVRTMPDKSPFKTWNWNAPFWFGVNTINVNGATCTMVGSAFWGLEVVEALRDHMEGTLRGLMACADQRVEIPKYKHSSSRETLQGCGV